MGRKRKHLRKAYQRRVGSSGQFIQLYYDLIDSDCFKDLSSRQIRLYVYCLREAHGEAMKDAARAGGEADECLFYMPRSRYVAHSLYTPNEGREFRRDIAALIDHGLIDCVQSGRRSKVKSLYRLSARWNAWPQVNTPTAVMTDYMLNELAKDRERG